MNEFKIGDQVVLKSGGPTMTVLLTDVADCATIQVGFFVNGTMVREWVLPDALTHAQPSSNLDLPPGD